MFSWFKRNKVIEGPMGTPGPAGATGTQGTQGFTGAPGTSVDQEFVLALMKAHLKPGSFKATK